MRRRSLGLSLAACALALTGCTSPLSQASSVTATPTVTLSPTPAPATPTPVILVVTATPASPGAPTSGPTAAVAPTVDPAAHDRAVVTRLGYDPSPRFAQVPDGFGHTLYAWHGVCHGSADGYCQKMFFFIDTRYLGTDTSADSRAIIDYQPGDAGTINVVYANYLNGDPLCCPSGPPVTISYHWTGQKLVPNGVPPGH